MEASWNAAEEQAIGETMAGGLGRIEAIRRLRSSWRIGETRPPMSREGRRMPEYNPRRGQTAQDATADRPEALTQASLLGGKASTAVPARLETKRLPKTASIRQARWRAKRKQAASPLVDKAA